MSVKLLTEHHLEFLSLTGGCTGSSESTLVKMPHCLKSYVTAHFNVMQYSQCIFRRQKEQKDKDNVSPGKCRL